MAQEPQPKEKTEEPYASSEEFFRVVDKAFDRRTYLLTQRACTLELWQRLEAAFPDKLKRANDIEWAIGPEVSKETCLSMMKEWISIWEFLVQRMPLTPEAKAEAAKKKASQGR